MANWLQVIWPELSGSVASRWIRGLVAVVISGSIGSITDMGFQFVSWAGAKEPQAFHLDKMMLLRSFGIVTVPAVLNYLLILKRKLDRISAQVARDEEDHETK